MEGSRPPLPAPGPVFNTQSRADFDANWDRQIACPSQFDPAGKLLAGAKQSPVVLVCRNGMASADAAKKLKKAGFEQVFWLDGGIAAWQAAGLPLVKGRG